VEPRDIFLRCNPMDVAVEIQEPSDFIYPFGGSIFYRRDINDDVEIGRCQAYYVDFVSAEEQGEAWFDVLDSHSASMAEYIELLNPKYNDFSKEVHKAAGMMSYGNLLILDRTEILPGYRGHDAGLLASLAIMRRLGHGAALFARKPFPLQFEAVDIEETDEFRRRMRLEEYKGDEKSGRAKIAAHWGRLGFKPVKGTPFVVRSTDFKLPAVSDIV
jgi:hypothetical protein